MNKYLIYLVGAGLLFGGCREDNSGAARDTKTSLMQMEQASVVVGMPAVQNWTEKRQLKALYELRDRANLITYTYIYDMNGKRHKVCPGPSIGYGIPYATQYTSPKSVVRRQPIYPDGHTITNDWHTVEQDQPEPNGLYMPASADGTWIICVHPETKQPAPTYVEPRVVVYLFEMPSVD